MLNLTQGAVSQKIARLEAQAGGRLLTRDRRGLGLTPAGERLLGQARRLLALNDEIWHDMNRGVVDGPVRFGLPTDLAGTVAVPLLKGLAASFPKIDPRLLCGTSSELRRLLGEGGLDAAVLEEPVSDATGECLAAERLVWAGAAGGIAYKRRPLPLSLVSDTCCFRATILATLARNGREVRMVFENGGLDATIAAVRADLAVSAWLASAVPPGFDALGRDADLPDLPPYAITLHWPDHLPSPAAAELIQHVRKSFERIRLG